MAVLFPSRETVSLEVSDSLENQPICGLWGWSEFSLVVHKMVPGGRIFQMFGNLSLFHRKYEFCHSGHGIVLCKAMLGIIVAAHSYSMIFLPAPNSTHPG